MSIAKDLREGKVTIADAIEALEKKLDAVAGRMETAGKVVDQLAEKRGSVKKGK